MHKKIFMWSNFAFITFLAIILLANSEPVYSAKHYLPDHLAALGMKPYPGAEYVTYYVEKKTGAVVTVFSTTDSAKDVLAYYKENMKNLAKYGFKQVKKIPEKFNNKGFETTSGNTLHYMRKMELLQITIIPHKNLENINKILVRDYRSR